MSKTSKQLANEWAQQNGVSLVWKTDRVGGQDHVPIFQSFIEIDGSVVTTTDPIYSTKKKSEQSVAAIFLEDLKDQKTEQKAITANTHVTVIIDVENVPAALYTETASPIHVIGVVHKNHKVLHWPERVTQYAVSSNYPNGSDMALVVLATKICSDLGTPIIIVSKDKKFAPAAVDALRDTFPNVSIELCVSLEDACEQGLIH